jgi:hypothetical protein
MFNPYIRYQKSITLDTLFPDAEGKCACGCNRKLEGRRKRWYSTECCDNAFTQFNIIRGDMPTIRKLLYQKDTGACNHCGLITDHWEADHIIPVHLGGGACDIDNFQTLCKDCHKAKTQIEAHHRAISVQAFETSFIINLCEAGENSIFSLKISEEKQSFGLALSPSSAICSLTHS